MRCTKCSSRAVYDGPALCSEHLSAFVERTVFDTIKRFRLISSGQKVIAATSGGKDSPCTGGYHALHRTKVEYGNLCHRCCP